MANIGGSSIYILDEAKNSTCAVEMLQRGDLIVPTFNHELRTDKPPLHYFFMMLSYIIFGINPFAARFFSAVFGALTMLLTFLFVRRFASSKAAWWSVFVLLSSIHLSIQFHLAVPDPYLIFFITSSVYFFYLALKDKRWKYLLALYVSIGLGALAKGPIAIGLPGLIFLLFLIFSKRFKSREIKQLKPFLGSIIVLIIALPWYVLVHLKTNGAWTEAFFMKHNLGRFASPMEGHGGLFFMTVLFVLAGLFPFSAFIVQALKKAFQQRKNDFFLLNLVAGFTIVVFFAISRTKLPNYTIPAYPYFAILIGLWICQLDFKTARLNASMIVLLVIGLIIPPTLFVVMKYFPNLSFVNTLAWYFIPLPIGFLLAFLSSMKGRKKAALYLIGATTMMTSLMFFCQVFPKVDQQNPVSQSIDLLKGKELRYYERYNPAYCFYIHHEIKRIDSNDFTAFFEKYPNGVIISTKKEIDELRLPKPIKISFSKHNLFEPRTTVLVTKQP